MSEPRVTVVIPAKDEEGLIGEIVDQVKPYADEVLVVDGHSRDRTPDIATAHGARVIRDRGHGKGDALRLAIDEAAGEIVVFIDADGSHDPADIPKLVAPILAGDADHVGASRLTGGSSELHGGFDELLRLTGSAFITACINAVHGVRLSDSQNGFRAMRTAVLRELDLREQGTTIEQEMIIKTLRRGRRMLEVPSHEHPRVHGASHIRVLRSAPRYGFSLVKNLFF